MAFGLFGAVMAVLAYTNRTSAPASRAPTSTAAPAGAPEPAAPDGPERGKGHGKDHGRD